MQPSKKSAIMQEDLLTASDEELLNFESGPSIDEEVLNMLQDALAEDEIPPEPFNASVEDILGIQSGPPIDEDVLNLLQDALAGNEILLPESPNVASGSIISELSNETEVVGPAVIFQESDTHVASSSIISEFANDMVAVRPAVIIGESDTHAYIDAAMPGTSDDKFVAPGTADFGTHMYDFDVDLFYADSSTVNMPDTSDGEPKLVEFACPEKKTRTPLKMCLDLRAKDGAELERKDGLLVNFVRFHLEEDQKTEKEKSVESTDTKSLESWDEVDIASVCSSQGAATPASVTQQFAGENYLRLLREAQESTTSSARVSLAGSRRDSPKSPPNSPVQGHTLRLEWQSYYINNETKEDPDFLNDWSSLPNQVPPKNWSFRQQKPDILSIRYARFGNNNIFSRKGLCTLLVTNIVSLLLGTGIGLLLSRHGFFLRVR